MSITIRPATVEDMPWLLDQLVQFDRFFGSSRSLFPTMEYAESVLAGLIQHQPFLVADNDHGPIGFIAGVLAPHHLNPDLQVLSELFWWVVPDHRGSRAGAALLGAFLRVGREKADWIIMTLEANSPVDPHSLISRGFRPKETSFLMECA